MFLQVIHEMTYQCDLFNPTGENVIRSFFLSETRSRNQKMKTLQLKEDGELGRVLNHDLREVKQLKETALGERMHGGVRGLETNHSTYSILIKKLMRIS
jgi:hypothetical protein